MVGSGSEKNGPGSATLSDRVLQSEHVGNMKIKPCIIAQNVLFHSIDVEQSSKGQEIIYLLYSQLNTFSGRQLI